MENDIICSYCKINPTRDAHHGDMGLSGSDWTIGIDLCVDCIIKSERREMMCEKSSTDPDRNNALGSGRPCTPHVAQWRVSDVSRVPRIACDNCWWICSDEGQQSLYDDAVRTRNGP